MARMHTNAENSFLHSCAFVPFVPFVALVLFFFVAASPTTAPDSTELPVARGGPAAGKREAKLEAYARIRGNSPVGVAVSRSGRVFLSFPGWDSPVDFSVGEVTSDGQLVPFPRTAPHHSAVQGICIDSKDRLWMLDNTTRSLVAFDLSSDTEMRTVRLADEAVAAGTYLNDLCIDSKRGADGFAYISDSARGAIIVVDLGAAQSWVALHDHPSTKGRGDIDLQTEGEPLRQRTKDGRDAPLVWNLDGITISPDGKTVYYTPFSGRDVWAIPADVLADRSATSEARARSVRKVCTMPSANDGLGCDDRGRIYATEFEHNAIRRIDPATGRSEVVVQDERLLWPDAVIVRDNMLYITTNQMNRQPQFHGGQDQRRQPYVLFRIPL